MVSVVTPIREDYWQNFKLQEDDLEFLYSHLLEIETPLTSYELVIALVNDRIQREKLAFEKQRTTGGEIYQPIKLFQQEQSLIFPAFGWQHGQVISVRPGKNPDIGEFNVIQVRFDDGNTREFASGLEYHLLNQPPKLPIDSNNLNANFVLQEYSNILTTIVEQYLHKNPDYVRIAGKWFPRALLVDINVGHLNLAEAVLDEAEGGPLSTAKLLEQIELAPDVNPKLVEFSFDLALQEDPRFDEVGPSGDVLWYLHRLEPPQVQDIPIFLRYNEMEYELSTMTEEMFALERALDDELSPIEAEFPQLDVEEIRLIFPHWISGTIPLSSRIQHLFPTAYEAPRIRFMLVDGITGDRFPGWVVREKRYVYGLKEWYEKRGLIPGGIVRVRKGNQPGEVIIETDSRRASREWIRTVLVGSDSGVVFAMLKQVISTSLDDRMAIAVPDKASLEQVWKRTQKEQPPFERVVVNTIRELAKLNPQGHVHASELYAAINMIMRCPPGPILSLMTARPWFIHVGDLHYRLKDAGHL